MAASSPVFSPTSSFGSLISCGKYFKTSTRSSARNLEAQPAQLAKVVRRIFLCATVAPNN
ncbi:uncharacterized protein METZ01_LOCUS195525 [marine metagenome]|uniref:Uncharacterized protein n=1 Tax=marine metagenome TaxID=408172 RepID=A0A382DY81_9ZZZZ